jgi:hypothetical protein
MRARLAQRLEHRICNAMVIGSTPIAGFFLFICSIYLFYMMDNFLFYLHFFILIQQYIYNTKLGSYMIFIHFISLVSFILFRFFF